MAEGVGAELNLYADRKVSAGEIRGKNAGILEAQVHTGAMRPETLARYRGIAPAYLARYCRMLSVRAYARGQHEGVFTTTQENILTHTHAYE